MEKVQLNFRNKDVELECDNPKEVKELAAKYNARIAEFGNPLKVSDVKVALVTGIKMEYEIEQLQSKQAAPAATTSAESEAELAETLDHITMYLDSLAKKVGNV